MKTELETLLSLIFKQGKLAIDGGRLLIFPPQLANQHADQIRRLKPEILLAFGYCPKCAGSLVIKIAELKGRTARHSHCQTVGHYDRWEK